MICRYFESMSFRRFVSGCQKFGRILTIAKERDLLFQKIKQNRAVQILYIPTAIGVTAFAVYLKPSLLLCEEKPDMAEVEKAEELYDAAKFKELYEYLVQFKDGDNPELLWRAVRAYRDRATMAEVSADEKKTLIFEAMEIAKKALQHGEDNYACHKWYGIMLSQTGDYLGTKVKLNNSPEMKKHFEKAIELCPTDATSHHLIGMWCFSFADLAWYERKLAAVVFGAPPSSTYEEALNHFLEAEKLNPAFYSANQFMIGLVNLKMGNKAAAKEWFTKLLDYKIVKDEDKEQVKKAQDQLKSL